MERLRAFFAENRPENVARVPELYAKIGAQAWAALELKYPGKTAKFTVVRIVIVMCTKQALLFLLVLPRPARTGLSPLRTGITAPTKTPWQAFA